MHHGQRLSPIRGGRRRVLLPELLCGRAFGDAALALGQTTVGAVKKSRALRDGRYPVFRQFKAGLGLVQREPWPPGAPRSLEILKATAIRPALLHVRARSAPRC